MGGVRFGKALTGAVSPTHGGLTRTGLRMRRARPTGSNSEAFRYASSPTHRGRARWLGWVVQLMNSESSLTMLRLGMAPISRFFSTPPMNSASVGMLMTP